MTNDEQLLGAYARERSESAFGELVARHIDFVYSTALRVVNGDSHLAQDVAQTVFIDLARKAGSLPGAVGLAGWLHHHTCYTAATAVRTERRRQTREQTAMEMRALDDNTRPEWELVAPYLDESLDQLNPADRDALVLRFLKQQDLRAVGEALGISDDAARKRVDRALEKLHVLLKHRGATLSAAALATALATEAVTAAPAGLAGAVTAAALSGTTVTTTAVIAATKAIAMTTLQKAIVCATAAVLAGAGIYEARQTYRLREQNLTLQQQQAPLAEQVQQLGRDQDDATRQLAALREENERLNRNNAELLKLRREVGALRSTAKELKQVETDPTLVAAKSALEKVNILKKWVEERPEQQIPEFKYLQDYDWIDAVKSSNMIGDNAPKNALSGLREAAKNQFAHEMSNALKRFVEEHNGDLPTDLSQLNAYFQQPMNDAILKAYKLLHTGKLADLPKNEWLVSEIAPPLDEHDSTSLLIGTDNWRRILR